MSEPSRKARSTLSPNPNPVISTEATDTVCCAVEKPASLPQPHPPASSLLYPLHKTVTHHKTGCPIHAVSPHEWAIAQSAIRLPQLTQDLVISTEATDSLTVCCAVEKPASLPQPHPAASGLQETPKGPDKSQSVRNAVIGSIFAARRAGITPATAADTSNTPIATSRLAGSYARTAYN
jgi:hypothetical protein